MQLYLNPPKSEWQKITARPVMELDAIIEMVRPIMNNVRQLGDEAIRQYTAAFDQVILDDLQVSEAEVQAALQMVDADLVTAMRVAKRNIETFHRAQLHTEAPVETIEGVQCWRQWRAIEKIGLYIPGGTAPLFSTLLMLATPASIAGVKEMILCTPPAKNGTIHPAILAAASVCGITNIFKAGGAQAIAAMTYGTQSIPQVYKILGPGNQYVTAAKQLAQLAGVAIDMPAGPSEVCVWADETANPQFVAADLLSQAEHGIDSQVMLVTNSADFAAKVGIEINQQLQNLPRAAIAKEALKNSVTLVMDNATQALDLINQYAAEHLIIACAEAEQKAMQINNAGSIFIGNYTPESAGDYASGTNHTLPTNGYAKAWSGVSIDTFMKKITVQKISKSGIGKLGPTIIKLAEVEGLQAHANAVKIRM